MKSFFLLIFVLVSLSINAQQQEKKTSFPDAEKVVNAVFTYKIIPTPNNQFGYDIYSNDKLFIHQTSIPSVPGLDGFKNKFDAEKIAELVIRKLKNGEVPPSVNSEELKKIISN